MGVINPFDVVAKNAIKPGKNYTLTILDDGELYNVCLYVNKKHVFGDKGKSLKALLAKVLAHLGV